MIILYDVCEINYDNCEYVSVYMVIYLYVYVFNSSK